MHMQEKQIKCNQKYQKEHGRDVGLSIHHRVVVVVVVVIIQRRNMVGVNI